MGKQTTEEKVREIIVEQLGVDPGEVKDEATIEGDLGDDHLDQIEVVMALEEAFDIEIPFEEADGAETVGALIKCVKERVDLKRD